jgi:hypothetical protein
MLRTWLLLTLPILASRLVAADCASAAEPAFEVVIDDAFHRPLIRRTPPDDEHGDKPLDVVKRFLDATNRGDFDAAAKLCQFGHRSPSETWTSVEGADFTRFSEMVRGSVKRVTLSGSTIPSSSSSVVYSKGKYWDVYFLREPASDEDRQGYFCLLQVDGVWKILEKPHWGRDVKGQRRSVNTGNVLAPKW